MDISDASTKELRHLIKQDYKKDVSLKEARRIGNWLIKFYGHLAEKKGTRQAEDGHPQLSTGTTDKISN